jgi:hypothetical protein
MAQHPFGLLFDFDVADSSVGIFTAQPPFSLLLEQQTQEFALNCWPNTSQVIGVACSLFAP